MTAIPIVAAERDASAASQAKVLARPYANPYLAGIGLGLVLLFAFVIVGRGLGASGGFASAAAATSSVIAPKATRANAYFSRYLSGNGRPTVDWLVIELS